MVCLDGTEFPIALWRAVTLLLAPKRPQLPAYCGTPRLRARASARTRSGVLHGCGGTDPLAVPTEWGPHGGARSHGKGLHSTSGNASHHPAPLGTVGASTVGGTAHGAWHKAACEHSPMQHQQLCMASG